MAAVVAIVCTGLAYSAQAQPASPERTHANTMTRSDELSFYLEYVGGIAFVRNQNVTGSGVTGAGLGGRADLSTGYAVGGAIGVRLYEIFRGEIQIAYHNAKLDNLSFRGGGEGTTAKGGLSALAFMANGYIDVPLERWTGLPIPIVPFLGAGVGYGEMEFEGRNRSGPNQTEIDDTDSVFLWNLMAGGTWPISSVVDLSLGYRYIASTDLRLNARTAGSVQRVESEWDSHELLAGLRLNF